MDPGDLAWSASGRHFPEQTALKANLAAVRCLLDIENTGRVADDADRRILARYVGWGGISTRHQWIEKLREAGIGQESVLRALRASTPNAHYTSPRIIQWMWRAVRHMGFDGGRVLEPAAGIGLFAGLCSLDGGGSATFTLVEKEPLAARIAAHLYPSARVMACGYEKAGLADSAFDLVITNVPFGNYRVDEPRYRAARLSIHDHFILKSLDKLRPGGIAAIITSTWTLDKQDRKAREAFYERADLMGAIRLPEDTFRQNAGTRVTTDVLFLRRRAPGEDPGPGDWLEAPEMVFDGEAAVPVNALFHGDGRGMVAGRLVRERGSGPFMSTVARDDIGELDAILEAFLERLPGGIMTAGFPQSAETVEDAAVVVGPGITGLSPRQEGSIVPMGHRFGVIEEGKARALEGLKAVEIKRLAALLPVRDAAYRVLQSQFDGEPDTAVHAARRTLADAYDRFVGAFGAINRPVNARLIEDDPGAALLYSLERYDDKTKSAVKTEIFFERVVGELALPAPETSHEALDQCLGSTGRVDPDRMARTLGRPWPEIRADLGARIFKDPDGGGWVTADLYLSGNVRLALQQAEQAAASDQEFEINVAALRDVQPAPLGPGQIHAALGATWLPKDILETFAVEVMGLGPVSIYRNPVSGAWSVTQNQPWMRGNPDFSTSRTDAVRILESSLNQIAIKVTFKDDDGRTQTNVKATVAAQAKQAALAHAFGNWLWADPGRARRLAGIYNETFNAYRAPRFDGSHLTLPGLSVLREMRPHQKNAIWRIVSSPSTLLAHTVGAGKTAVMVGACVELRRLGLARRPLVVVPKSTLSQFAGEAVRFFPGAKILIAEGRDLSPRGRQRFLARALTDRWDAIVMTHESLKRIPVSREMEMEHLREQIEQYQMALAGDEAPSRETKRMEKAKAGLEAKLSALIKSDAKDDGFDWETLGFDALFVDEAHLFKNLNTVTRMTDIPGVSVSPSQRSEDLLMKLSHLQDRGGRTAFATATPVANTVTEMHVVLRYLDSQGLVVRGVEHFDAWAATFGQVAASMELDPGGSGYRVRSRMAKFANVPELLGHFHQIADVQTVDDLALPLPAVDRHVVTTAPPEATRRYMEVLRARADACRARLVDPWEDNLLNIMTDGRKAALDLRLIDQRAGEQPDGKIMACAGNVHRIWEDSAADRGTQIVFCDLSTPRRTDWSVYGALRERLVAMGIPEEEVAFIHEHDSPTARERLFNEVREGRVRVLLGSTGKMGVGVNVQTRLVALHHMDAPWRPADVEQREGRGVRQGNLNARLGIYTYVTEGTLDEFIWDALRRKAGFIGQVIRPVDGATERSVSEEIAVSYEEIMAAATGNPLIREKCELDQQVERLRILAAAHRETATTSAWRAESKEASAEAMARGAAACQNLVDIMVAHREVEAAKVETESGEQMILDGEPSTGTRRRPGKHREGLGITIGDERHDRHKEAGEAMLDAADRFSARLTGNGAQEFLPLGSYQGICLSLRGHLFAGSRYFAVHLHGPDEQPDRSDMLQFELPDNPVTAVQRLVHLVVDLPDLAARKAASAAALTVEARDLRARVAVPFPEEDELARLSARQAEVSALLIEQGAQSGPALTVEEAQASFEDILNGVDGPDTGPGTTGAFRVPTQVARAVTGPSPAV